MSALAASIEHLQAQFGVGAFRPSDTLAQCRAAVEAQNSALNAIVHADWTNAAQSAQESDVRWRRGQPLSVLDGVPIAVKANCAIVGLPWTAAVKLFERQLAQQDSHVVSLLRAAGAVIIGGANMHEAALGATTTSLLYGPCFNPRRSGYSPGGSSGGSAAAVAAGFCAGAVGTDTMGSVRIPSAYCGVVGFKPSYGRVSRRGVIPLSHTLDHVGFHGRKVADVDAFYRVCARFDAKDPHALDYGVRAPPEMNGTRIGVARTRVTLEAPVAAAFECAVARLSAAGADIVEIDLTGLDCSNLRRRGLLICEAELLAEYPQLMADPTLLSEDLARALEWGGRQLAPTLADAYARRSVAINAARQAFALADVILTPTAPHLAFPLQQAAPETQADLTVLANFAQLPALCIPIDTEGENVPASLQVMGPTGGDERVLAFAQFAESVLVS